MSLCSDLPVTWSWYCNTGFCSPPTRYVTIDLWLFDLWFSNIYSGKGEFGEVLLSKAKCIEENQEDTVVLVKSLQTRDEQLQLDFRREAEMFGKLSHPNVVRLLGLCRETEPHYVILEYYDLVNTQMHVHKKTYIYI